MKTPDNSEINRIYGAEPQKISLHLKLRYILEEDQRWHFHIIVDDMTTAGELREAWVKIDTAREELKYWQGSDTKWFSVALLLDLEQQKRRLSYGKLAMDLNFDALVFLIWATDTSKGKDRENAGRIIFVNLLKALGMKNEDIKAWEIQGKENIANGIIPWGVKDSLIDRQRVVDILRQFDNQQEQRKFIVKARDDTKYIINIRIASLIYGYWQQAGELLKRLKRDEYKVYEKRFNERTCELIEKNNEFSGLKSQ